MSGKHVAAASQLVLLALVVACLAEEPSSDTAQRIRRGREAYLSEGCASCHGPQRQGGKTGPSLARVSRHWTADDLVRYLRNPRGYAKSARLQRLTERYPGEMAGLPAAGDEKLRDLVAFLLSR